ncbi:hypothetical protein [Brachyspira pilosicoli]|uniref:hypothetical protein n=1 Tax=Brachyspira pilosicoli TaxID=52584 RepID=UPI0030044975
MFYLIKEPDENPTNLLDSYRQQNIVMQKIRLLHTAFDGIKLNHWNDSDRELPDILAGSICEFEGRLFETNETIKLSDSSSSEGSRFIKLAIVRDANNSNNDYLEVQVVSNNFPSYDYNNRGFYHLDSQGRCSDKYLRLSMKYSQPLGGYVEKKYWNINDFERKGTVLKRKTVNFGSGEYEFIFPSDVNLVTVHITSGGGGAGMCILDTESTGYHNATDGSSSQILVNGEVITTCGGGGGGKMTGLSSISSSGGIASGQGKLYQGTDGNRGKPGRGGIISSPCLAGGGNGGNGIEHDIGNKDSIGGGSGSSAIVDINRGMLQGTSKIKLIVGTGGASGYRDNNETRMQNGENGSAVIEYMQK